MEELFELVCGLEVQLLTVEFAQLGWKPEKLDSEDEKQLQEIEKTTMEVVAELLGTFNYLGWTESDKEVFSAINEDVNINKHKQLQFIILSKIMNQRSVTLTDENFEEFKLDIISKVRNQKADKKVKDLLDKAV